MFSGLSNFQNLAGNKDQQAQQTTAQPEPVASAPTNSFASIFGNAPQERPAPPSLPPPKKDEQQTSSAPSSSGLFGPISTGAQAPAQSGGMSSGMSGGIGGNWLNQIKSEPKANDSGSIFTRLNNQPGAGTAQPPAANSLFATKQQSEAQDATKTTLNFGSPQKTASTGNNMLFGGNNPATGGDTNKPAGGLFSAIMGGNASTGGSGNTIGGSGLFGNLNSTGNAGGNAGAGANAGGSGGGMFSSLFSNQNASSSSLFGSK